MEGRIMKYALIIDGIVKQVQPNEEIGFVEVDDEVVCGMVKEGAGFIIPPKTADELEALKPKEVSRAQFFAALILSNLDEIVDNAVITSGDKLLINDYKNRLTFRRDWASFILMGNALGKTDIEIDALFQLASEQ